MKYTFPIVAINRSNETKLFYNVADLLKFVYSTRPRKWSNPLVGDEWIFYPQYYYPKTYRPWEPEFITNDWILRDDKGHPVDWHSLEPARPNWKNRKGNFEYRNGPVPGRGGCGGGSQGLSKKNSGAGARNRLRASYQEACNEYGIKNRHGKPIRYEHW